jgi:ABC-type nitrate/sulfonate/bicarbonate transport system permease component
MSVTTAAARAGKDVLRGLLNLVVSLLAVAAIWFLLLRVFEVTSFIGKTPLDVWAFLVTDPEAAANRELILGQLGITLADAAIGFVTGLVAAIVVATVFTLFQGVEHALMPMAMLLRSVPLVAMAPIIILVFGRAEASVAAMGAVVVLFPALVTVVQGLRSANPMIVEVVKVYGGSTFDAFRKVALPSALPSLFTALRVSIPGALTGALLAEWLATGEGIGYAIVSNVARARYDEVWAAVVVVTVASILLYSLVSLLESVVNARSGGSR